jgi:cholesterol transport system auxiliary component
MEGLTADYQLVIDIHSLQIAPGPTGSPIAQVEFAAKVVGDGRIVGSRTFSASAPAPDTHAAGAVAAIDKAFGQAATDLVVWTGTVI